MRLQERDIEIINHAEKTGGTIQHYADLWWNGNYKMADKRLVTLEKINCSRISSSNIK